MPRLKTESEVATMQYLRERTDIPVPTVYHYDANPYNRLGGEYIIMSKVRVLTSLTWVPAVSWRCLGTRHPTREGLPFDGPQRVGRAHG